MKGMYYKLNEWCYWLSKGIEILECEMIGQFCVDMDDVLFCEGMDVMMCYFVESGVNWQGMSIYVLYGWKCFWFSLVEDGFVVDVELDGLDLDEIEFVDFIWWSLL